MAIKRHVQHIRSSVPESVPTAEQLTYGEIAINYSTDNERMFIKNANNDIIPFYSGKVIEENERVTAKALTDVDQRLLAQESEFNTYVNSTNTRIENIESNIPNLENMETALYSDIKAKINASSLVPGKFYRITDYTTTTTQEGTQSAGHQFDIIVLAINDHTLSENAHAIQHEGDTYFSDVNVQSWDIKYCFDNNKDRFYWADTDNGKGVIYYMEDEWHNVCYYDFKNIMFTRKILNKKFDQENGVDTMVYTFTWITEQSEIEDASIVCQDMIGYPSNQWGVRNNRILPFSAGSATEWQQGKKSFVLNDNVFISPNGYFEGIFFGICGNIIHADCYSNTFTCDFNYNTLFEQSKHNVFGNRCQKCIFGINFSDNILTGETRFCTFGQHCLNNTIGALTTSMSFGDNCQNITIGDNSTALSFGNSCQNITIGNNAATMSFGNNCQNITIGANSNQIFVGNGCQDISLLQMYTRNIIIEDGNIGIQLTSATQTDNLSSLSNIKITIGCNNDKDNPKTITHPTLNDTFNTTYAPQGSTTINI